MKSVKKKRSLSTSLERNWAFEQTRLSKMFKFETQAKLRDAAYKDIRECRNFAQQQKNGHFNSLDNAFFKYYISIKRRFAGLNNGIGLFSALVKGKPFNVANGNIFSCADF